MWFGERYKESTKPEVVILLLPHTGSKIFWPSFLGHIRLKGAGYSERWGERVTQCDQNYNLIERWFHCGSSHISILTPTFFSSYLYDTLCANITEFAVPRSHFPQLFYRIQYIIVLHITEHVPLYHSLSHNKKYLSFYGHGIY